MDSVCGFRLGRGEVLYVRTGSHRRMSKHAFTIRRSVLRSLLYCPSPFAGRLGNRDLRCSCLYGEVGRSGVRLELPLYSDRVVGDLPHCVAMVWAPMPRHQTGIAVCALGSFWLGH